MVPLPGLRPSSGTQVPRGDSSDIPQACMRGKERVGKSEWERVRKSEIEWERAGEGWERGGRARESKERVGESVSTRVC